MNPGNPPGYGPGPGDWNGFPSSEYAFPSKFYIYLEHCPRGEALIISHLHFSSNEVASHVKQLPFRPLLLKERACLQT